MSTIPLLSLILSLPFLARWPLWEAHTLGGLRGGCRAPATRDIQYSTWRHFLTTCVSNRISSRHPQSSRNLAGYNHVIGGVNDYRLPSSTPPPSQREDLRNFQVAADLRQHSMCKIAWPYARCPQLVLEMPLVPPPFRFSRTYLAWSPATLHGGKLAAILFGKAPHSIAKPAYNKPYPGPSLDRGESRLAFSFEAYMKDYAAT
ncbi:hypothetical protein BU15DRAFT_60616 [Melanogaster broomeanus]|nr:hypothetical protein BU15DRAFT_60616 [Melanogaster broomeanus]